MLGSQSESNKRRLLYIYIIFDRNETRRPTDRPTELVSTRRNFSNLYPLAFIDILLRSVICMIVRNKTKGKTKKRRRKKNTAETRLSSLEMYSNNFAAAFWDLFEFLICCARQGEINNETATCLRCRASYFVQYLYYILYKFSICARPAYNKH